MLPFFLDIRCPINALFIRFNKHYRGSGLGLGGFMNRGDALVKTVRNFLSVGILFLCAGSIAFAQAGRGSISGLVTDPAGAVVAGAKVVLLDRSTGATQHTLSSSAGLYTFISLNPGVYQVTASQTGFKSVAQEKITVTVDQVTEA